MNIIVNEQTKFYSEIKNIIESYTIKKLNKMNY